MNRQLYGWVNNNYREYQRKERMEMNLGCRILEVENLDKLKNEKLIIYGAGQYGSFLYSFLEMRGLEKNVICFAVTESLKNPDIFHGKPVKPIDRIGEQLKTCMVILAFGEKAFNEVSENLRYYTVKNMCRVNGQVIEAIRRELIVEYKKLPLQKNKIILSSYDGMGYRCNCKYIAESLLQNNAPVELVWLVSDNTVNDLPGEITKVVINSPQLYKEVLTAKVYITNTEHLLYEHKREGQFFINTWHGYGPFKKVKGDYTTGKEHLIKSNRACDLFTTASSFYTYIYRNSFYYQGKVLECGAPRNDVFFQNNDLSDKIRQTYQIPQEKGIVLYAPTFRSLTGDMLEKYDLKWEDILKALKERFGKDYVIVYRLHYYLHNLVTKNGLYEHAVDATFYPDVQELLVAADIVITDYSSLMWDFSLQRRPVFLYQNDEEEYTNDRGFYAPVSHWPYPKAHSQEELAEQIRLFDEEKYVAELNAFLEMYGSCDDGHASERVAKKILEVINGGCTY